MKITEQNLLKELKNKNPQAIEYIIDQYGGAIKAVLNKKKDKVYFDGMIENGYLYGTRKNDDKMTYELDEKDISYVLKTEEGEEIMITP